MGELFTAKLAKENIDRNRVRAIIYEIELIEKREEEYADLLKDENLSDDPFRPVYRHFWEVC